MVADVVGQPAALLLVQSLLPEGADLAEVRVELVEPVGLPLHGQLAGSLLRARALLGSAVGERGARSEYSVQEARRNVKKGVKNLSNVDVGFG